MLFKRELIDKIVMNQKTQTRRPAAPEPNGETIAGTEMLCWPGGKLAVQKGSKDDRRWITKWQVGNSYAVCPGRGKPTMRYGDLRLYIRLPEEADGGMVDNDKPIRIEVVNLRRQDVRQISDADVKAEGFETFEQFINVWTAFYDKPASKYLNGPDGFSRGYLATRPAHLYDAWVIEFKRI